jgi:hypothetical protein
MLVTDGTVTSLFLRASIMVTMGNGTSTFFWIDRWLNGQGIENLAPELLTVVSVCRRKKWMVRSTLNGNAWLGDIVGPLTLPVIIQYIQIRALVDTVVLSDKEDSVAWRWSSTGDFTSKLAYSMMFMVETGLHGTQEV